ncbi:MAG TPA: CHRD domain-containing protein, partial [Caldilineaceae bacterium]|nr:CHRD domain-containing protein [Caldilineaceae bacterium]
MLDGAYYVNVHTAEHGSGEIAGAIVPFTPPTGYSALLSGENERPNPVDTAAIGVASFTRVSTATLDYQITISNSTAITLGHIHRGAVDEAGGVVQPLYNSPTPLAELTPLTGSVELDAKGMVDLLTGYLYVNFHTAAHPGGEIRGQIGGAHLFGANLNGNEEEPAVDTLAYATAVIGLNA